jgi:hypothetical protein
MFKVWEQQLYFMMPYGQHDIVPMKHCIFGRVCNTDGVLLRREKDVYSQILGLLPYNTVVVIDNKDFSAIPTQKNVKRYKIFPNKGWVNACSGYEDHVNIDIIGTADNPCALAEQTTVISLDPSPFQDFSNTNVLTDSCIICLQHPRTIAVLHQEYGHLIYCKTCAEKMKEKNEKCPICRTQVHQYLRMY